MSSESSVSSSRIRQFGLYRTIDARTEEFLKLSRKRQMRQGCACAAASTAITVTVVVVILLIYEYAIAVEWSVVQRRRGVNETNEVTIITNDSPFADRLDRSNFGFDQDYFERMPLLINDLQESNYIDPVLEMTRPISKKHYNKSLTTTKPVATTDFTHRQSNIRKTSPRPFIFEYRSPTPLPFSRTYGSRSWVDSYRNAQRLQNIRQVIKYLEKTINAKMGDMYTKPLSTHTSIAFSGVYVEPMVDKHHDSDHLSQDMDLLQQSSNKVDSYHLNHQSDPLFNFKPNNPGDVNLLADRLWRFSPSLGPITSITNNKVNNNIPMFKRLPNYRKYCTNGKCNESVNSKVVDLLQNSSEQNTEPFLQKPKSFSVMLNLYPYKPSLNTEQINNQDVKTRPPLENIYFTTANPTKVQFRRKLTLPLRQNNYHYKKPRYLLQKRNQIATNRNKHAFVEETTRKLDSGSATPSIVHMNFYSLEDNTDLKKTIDMVTTTTQSSTITPISETAFEIKSGQVEDYHAGSSGVIPVHERIESPTFPQVTTMIPFFDSDTTSSEVSTWSTNLPDVLKFNAEDAKVPDHYINLMDKTEVLPTEVNRRNSVTTEIDKTNYAEKSEAVGSENVQTLIIKLKNDVFTSTTTEKYIESTTEEIEELTTLGTYEPQINGHYRSFSTRDTTTISPEWKRKRRLEMSVSGFHTYVPMYVEIIRNNTSEVKDDD